MVKDFLWWRDGVIYQIYPRSFSDSNGDGIGDLQGIIDKLDYLQDLGIDAIWLSPVNPSPDVDFGYDVADYRDIDPKYGSLKVFDQLVAGAHSRGIKVILDLVLNHTSDQHPWFIESRSSRDNPKRDWYLWSTNPQRKDIPPNNWLSWFGGKAWEYDERTGEYYYHMFYKEQPDLNWRNSQVRNEMMDVFRFWADKEVDGFRLDVFNEYFKDAQFRDNPSRIGHRGFDRQHHPYDTNQPEIMDVVKEIRSVLDGYPDRYAVGEPFLSPVEQAAGYCGPGKLHATFDFTFLSTRWSPARYLEAILQWQKLIHPDAWPCYVLNNHDNIRSATRFKCGEKDEQLKVAAAMLLTLRGTPFIYYGEEIGMRDLAVSKMDMQDRVGRTYWPAPVGRDGCRSPMQWNASENSGFTTGSPWIKVHPNSITRNVERQQSDPRSLLNFYRKLLKVRKEHRALQRGMFIPLIHNPQRVLAYLRQDETETILVALNFTRRPSKLAMGGELTRHFWEMLVSNREKNQPSFEKGWLKLEGYEVCILVQKDPAGG